MSFTLDFVWYDINKWLNDLWSWLFNTFIRLHFFLEWFTIPPGFDNALDSILLCCFVGLMQTSNLTVQKPNYYRMCTPTVVSGMRISPFHQLGLNVKWLVTNWNILIPAALFQWEALTYFFNLIQMVFNCLGVFLGQAVYSFYIKGESLCFLWMWFDVLFSTEDGKYERYL